MNRDRWFRRSALAVGVLALTGAAGCWHPPPPTARQTEIGLVYMLPGVGGGPWSLRWAHNGLRAAGVEAEIRMFDWHRPFNALGNLVDHQGNRAKADEVAAEIAAYRHARPAAAIDIVGYSGGGGLAVMVAEALPPDVHLRNIVLVQAALSPDYDLTAALAHVDGKLVSFYCPSDWFVLGMGTRTFGTMDRRKVASAGKDGFDLEKAVPDAALRKKVEQRCWNREMLKTGHIGTHLGILLYTWNKRYVAPYLLMPTERLPDSAAEP